MPRVSYINVLNDEGQETVVKRYRGKAVHDAGVEGVYMVNGGRIVIKWHMDVSQA